MIYGWWWFGFACVQNHWGSAILNFACNNERKLKEIMLSHWRIAACNSTTVIIFLCQYSKLMSFITLGCLWCYCRYYGCPLCRKVCDFNWNLKHHFHCSHSWMTFSRVPEALVGMNESYLCLPEQILSTLSCIVLPDSPSRAAREMDTQKCFWIWKIKISIL